MLKGDWHAINAVEGPPKQLFLSHAVRAGDFVFVSGVIGVRADNGRPLEVNDDWSPGSLVAGGITEQTHQAFENLRAVLRASGCDLTDVVKMNCFLSNKDRDFSSFNLVYMSYFKDKIPARTTVEAKILSEVLVELECVAYSP